MATGIPAFGFTPGTGASVAATASSVGTTITMTGADGLYIVNASTTLTVWVRFGVGAQTAVVDTDLPIPPTGAVIVGANEAVTHVAAIGSGAGPTTVTFMPVRRGW